MRITCPTCSAEYDVPGPLAPGRSVRCARCGNKWAPVTAPEPVFELPPEPEPEPPPPPPEAAPVVPVVAPTPLVPPVTAKPLPPRTLILAWVGSGVLIVALVAAAILWREPIMRVWPPSIRVYSTLRLDAHP